MNAMHTANGLKAISRFARVSILAVSWGQTSAFALTESGHSSLEPSSVEGRTLSSKLQLRYKARQAPFDNKARLSTSVASSIRQHDRSAVCEAVV